MASQFKMFDSVRFYSKKYEKFFSGFVTDPLTNQGKIVITSVDRSFMKSVIIDPEYVKPWHMTKGIENMIKQTKALMEKKIIEEANQLRQEAKALRDKAKILTKEATLLTREAKLLTKEKKTKKSSRKK